MYLIFFMASRRGENISVSLRICVLFDFSMSLMYMMKKRELSIAPYETPAATHICMRILDAVPLTIM